MENVEPDNPEQVIQRFHLGLPDKRMLGSGHAFIVYSSLKYILPYLEKKVIASVHDFRRFSAGPGEIGLDLPEVETSATSARLVLPAYYFVHNDPNFPLIPRVYSLGTGVEINIIEFAEGRCKIEVQWYMPYLQPLFFDIKEDLTFCCPEAALRSRVLPFSASGTELPASSTLPNTGGQTPPANTLQQATRNWEIQKRAEGPKSQASSTNEEREGRFAASALKKTCRTN